MNFNEIAPIATLAAVVLGILRNEFALGSVERHVNSRFDSLESHVNSRIDSLEKVMEAKFEAQTQGLLRVEQVSRRAA